MNENVFFNAAFNKDGCALVLYRSDYDDFYIVKDITIKKCEIVSIVRLADESLMKKIIDMVERFYYIKLEQKQVNTATIDFVAGY